MVVLASSVVNESIYHFFFFSSGYFLNAHKVGSVEMLCEIEV